MTEVQKGLLYNGIITDKKKAAKEFKDMFKKNQPFLVNVEENFSTIKQRLDEPTIDKWNG